MDAIHIVKVEQEGEDGVLITFSDGTIGGYVVEELLELRPSREMVSVTTRPNYHRSEGVAELLRTAQPTFPEPVTLKSHIGDLSKSRRERRSRYLHGSA
jgi:hypothetical protein